MSTPYQLPSDYDNVVIKVDPTAVSAAATKISGAVSDINNQVTALLNCLADLKISWTGDSASVAQDFMQRWTTATKVLFGDSKHKSDAGVLGTLVNGLSGVAQNYTDTETTVSQSFQALFDALLNPGPGTPNALPPSVNNHNPVYGTKDPYQDTSVDEEFD